MNSSLRSGRSRVLWRTRILLRQQLRSLLLHLSKAALQDLTLAMHLVAAMQVKKRLLNKRWLSNATYTEINMSFYIRFLFLCLTFPSCVSYVHTIPYHAYIHNPQRCRTARGAGPCTGRAQQQLCRVLRW